MLNLVINCSKLLKVNHCQNGQFIILFRVTTIYNILKSYFFKLIERIVLRKRLWKTKSGTSLKFMHSTEHGLVLSNDAYMISIDKAHYS